jgi:hypothetical protein
MLGSGAKVSTIECHTYMISFFYYFVIGKLSEISGLLELDQWICSSKSRRIAGLYLCEPS